MMLFSSAVGKSVTSLGMTCVARAPAGTKLFKATGPEPSARLPRPLLVPSKITADTVAQITSFSSDRTGTPATSRLLASKKKPGGGSNFTRLPCVMYWVLLLLKEPMLCGAAEVPT